MVNDVEPARGDSLRTLLIVDDTPENLTVLGEVLMPHYRVRVASSGARALVAATSAPRPDLILLDVMMPEMDGYEVLHRLRTSGETKDIPVIFVTALDSTDDESHGLELGAVDYITKPIRPGIVLARVRTQLELKDARDRLQDQNAWLEAEVQRRMRQNRVIQDVTMRALASLAEVRDNETGSHIVRTQSYVRILAEELSRRPAYGAILTPQLVDTIVKAAPLHDLGKVGIPDQILHKPGRLSPDEWEVMKTHSKLGADAIWGAIRDEEDRSALDFLYIAMEIARYHHEKWDGTGYPEGLATERIPLPARLMAVADVFDAMTTVRVYKPAFAVDDAICAIRDGSGSHFDPEIVAAFMARADDMRAVAQQYWDPALQGQAGAMA